jgi:hypothetical protein
MQGQIWVESVGEIIVARTRGDPTEQNFVERQERILAIAQQTGIAKVLYDNLEMNSLTLEVALSQRRLDATLNGVHLRRAIVVPSTRLAYLARLAFAEGDYRIFYNEIVAAVAWLASDSSASTPRRGG